jgi:hypothetical protein
MAILENTKEIGFEAAGSRFFYDYEPDPYQFESLSPIQETVTQLAACMREFGRTAMAKSEAGQLQQRNNLKALEAMLAALDQKVKGCSGWLTISFPRTNYLRTNEAALMSDYHVTDDDEGRAILFVPAEAITAFRSNPHFYDTGHTTQPVIDLRVQTSSDPVSTPNRFAPAQPSLGLWTQFCLDKAELGLLQ